MPFTSSINMKQALALSALGLGASVTAAPQHHNGTCFQLTAHGPAHGRLGQLGDGQNRVGGHYGVATYCLKDTSIVDDHGRGCILTPPTTQFQCDEGAKPHHGFSIGCNGQLFHKARPTFWSCPVNDFGEWNVYTQPAPGQLKCVEITLSATAATPFWLSHASCKAPPSPPAPIQPPVHHDDCGHPNKPCNKTFPPPHSPLHLIPSPIRPPLVLTPPKAHHHHHHHGCPANCSCSSHKCHSSQNKGHCPIDLKGEFQFPHLIIPVDKNQPDKSFSTSLNGVASPDVCSIFNFDIPARYQGKTCSLVFLFPFKGEMETSDWVLSGKGDLIVSSLKEPAIEGKTTWNHQPEEKDTFAAINLLPGTGYLVWTGTCPAGEKIAYKTCSNGSLELEYFQDFNPSPIGLYIREC